MKNEGNKSKEPRLGDCNDRGAEEKERSAVSQHWPQIDLFSCNGPEEEKRGEEERGERKECLGLLNPSCPLSLLAPPSISPPAKQGGGKDGGRRGCW